MVRDAQRERVLRQIIQGKDKKRERQAVQYAWYGLCKEVAVKRAEYRVM